MPTSARCLALKAVMATGTVSIFSSRLVATTVISVTAAAPELSADVGSAAKAGDAERLAATAKAEPPHRNADLNNGSPLNCGFLNARLLLRDRPSPAGN